MLAQDHTASAGHARRSSDLICGQGSSSHGGWFGKHSLSVSLPELNMHDDMTRRARSGQQGDKP